MIHDFSDKKLLTLALTHSSASKDNNERLEFLGDSIVNFIVGEYLFQQFPQAQEGQLSRMRAALVKGEALAKLAQMLHLSELVIVGPGETRVRSSILEGAMEALIGAIYLDTDLDTCRRCVLDWYSDSLKTMTLEQQHVDAKTQLQEILQAQHLALPVYSVVEQQGPAHKQIFMVECCVEALGHVTQAQGHNRKKAEQMAAQLMLEKIQHV
jgi:ribonuclease-3